jgi:hypothetical protein
MQCNSLDKQLAQIWEYRFCPIFKMINKIYRDLNKQNEETILKY